MLKTCKKRLHLYDEEVRRCPECLKIKEKRCREKRKKAKKDYDKKRYLLDPEKRKKEVEKYQQENKRKISEYKTQYREQHREEFKKYSKTYYRKYPAEHLARVRKRQAIKSQRTPSWLSKEHFGQIEDFYLSSRMRTLFTGINHVVDHIVPLRGRTVCGLHVPWNLQVITAKENQSKGNKF